MMDYKEYFKGKSITLMRIGLLGRGVGDAAFLAKCGANILVVDDAPKKVMQPSVNKLKKFKNIKFKFGPYDLNDFRNCNFVLKGAGAPLDSPEIAEAKRNNIPVEMSASLFAKLAGIPIIGVTGTRGKSTVTHLIYHILKTAKKKVLLGGNVIGVSTLALLPEASKADFALFELDSWQLQGFGDNKISPQFSIFTTFLPDHMNYYKDNMQTYFGDKANIFKYQKENDLLILGSEVAPFIKDKKSIKSILIIPTANLPQGFKLSIPGRHNIYNATLAVEVARRLGIKDSVIKKALKSFKGVSGRLEFLREVKGVKYYNDTTATTPDATIAALRALEDLRFKNYDLRKVHSINKSRIINHKSKRIILIMGGSDKGLEMTDLLKIIPRYVKYVIMLSGSGSDRIKNMIKGYRETNSMKEAMQAARQYAEADDIILLSPAFASFGMFRNEFHRGEEFVKLVKKIK